MNFNNSHDVDNTYTWSSTGTSPDGTLFTDFLGKLNNCTSADGSSFVGEGFAGHCDWRIPNIAELRTILLEQFPDCTASPCIDSIFGPTKANFYWSSTTRADGSFVAWVVNFGDGIVFGGDKDFVNFFARAVSGGR